MARLAAWALARLESGGRVASVRDASAFDAEGVLSDRFFQEAEEAHASGDLMRARVALECGLASAPGRVDRLAQLADTERACGCPAAAARTARRALSIDPQSDAAWFVLGEALRAMGDADGAVEAFTAAAHRSGDPAAAVDNRLLTMLYSSSASGLDVAAAHRAWGATLAGLEDPAWRVVDASALDGTRRLRVGFVSADFGFHVVSFFVAEVLACLVRQGVHVVGYSNAAREDAQLRSLRARVDAWRDISGMTTAHAMQTLRSDRLDVVVDLSGHTRGHRLDVLAGRVAPVQVTWLGYPHSTGLVSVDWRITDPIADPPGLTDHLHTERLWRLSRPFVSWTPPADAPAVADLPWTSRGAPTFGSFNSPAKISDAALEAWARILAAVPGATLLLKGHGLDEPALGQSVRERFARVRGDPSRLRLRGQCREYRDHLAAYGEVDIALDTVPYNGTTTTCEALWMGVPVLTLCGDAHASRVGASLLHAIGRDEWVGATVQDWCDKAAVLASDRDRLTAIRTQLRQEVVTSTLVDGDGMADALLGAWTTMLAMARRIGGA